MTTRLRIERRGRVSEDGEIVTLDAHGNQYPADVTGDLMALFVGRVVHLTVQEVDSDEDQARTEGTGRGERL
jgi:hypothetical protein